jgi:hypothetical protein
MLRVRVEVVLALLCAVLAAATMIWPTWIESLTGLEPDAGTGETEWWIVLVFAVGAIAAAVLARRDHRRALRDRPQQAE